MNSNFMSEVIKMRWLFISFVVFFIVNCHYQVEAVHSQPFLNYTKADRVKRDENDAPYEFTITLEHNKKIISRKFVLIERSLANEHLPVWRAYKNSDQTMIYQQNKHVMKEIGPFFFYQNQLDDTAIYFSKHGLLNGYIGARYVIQNLPWDRRDDIFVVGGPYVFEREIIEHANPPIDGGPPRQKLRPPRNPSSNKINQHFYPELLVVVDNGLYREYSQDPVPNLSNQASVVYHMLTKFHAADMLFQHVPDPIFHLNIAAIVIEVESNGILIRQAPVRSMSCGNFPNDAIIHDIQKNFYLNDNIFPPDSFDIVMVMTKDTFSSKNRTESTEGLTFSTTSDVVTFRIKPCLSVPFITFIRVTNYNSASMAISHQIANVLINGYHYNDGDSSGYRFTNNPCQLHVVHDVNKIMCEGCLQWDNNISHRFRRFSESRNACIFINTPRSLFPYGPTVMLTKEEQCLCYGHRNLANNYVNCRSYIKCSDSQSEHSELPWPFDGTPCDSDKVCWNNQCVHVSPQ